MDRAVRAVLSAFMRVLTGSPLRRVAGFIAGVSLLIGSVEAWPATGVIAPFADIHLHYNWDQSEILSPREAVARLRENGVGFGVVSSQPPESALDLIEAADGMLIALFMPYLDTDSKRDWFFDSRVLGATRAALAGGTFRGIGEIHLISGWTPSLVQRQPNIDGMLELALEFDVPILIHAEASDHRYFLPLCQRYPGARILWAHLGGVMPPAEVARLLDACPHVWGELSARDPMRYGASQPIVAADGRLLPEWKDLVLRYQDRLMVGSDPYFYDDLKGWDQPNTGWAHVSAIITFHRRWLDALPAQAARKIAWENAQRFFSPKTGR